MKLTLIKNGETVLEQEIEDKDNNLIDTILEPYGNDEIVSYEIQFKPGIILERGDPEEGENIADVVVKLK